MEKAKGYVGWDDHAVEMTDLLAATDKNETKAYSPRI